MGNTTSLTDDRRFNRAVAHCPQAVRWFFWQLGLFDQGMTKSRRREFAVVVALTKSGFDPVQIQMRGDKIGDFPLARVVSSAGISWLVVKFGNSIKAVSQPASQESLF